MIPKKNKEEARRLLAQAKKLVKAEIPDIREMTDEFLHLPAFSQIAVLFGEKADWIQDELEKAVDNASEKELSDLWKKIRHYQKRPFKPNWK